MNTSGSSMAEVSEDEPRRTASAPVARHLTRTALVTLIRREFWEHRALWMMPLVVSGLLLLAAIPASLNFHLDIDPEGPWFDREHRAVLFAAAQWLLTGPQFLVAAIVINFYLLDCLYAERKDRSLLFWKSLPVSDGATVGTKLLVALVVVPLGVFITQLITGVLFAAIWNTVAALRHSDTPVVWDTLAWIQLQALLLVQLLAVVLWWAPIAGYLLLVSAWARRNVFLWSFLPPVLALPLEKIAFGTHHFVDLIGYRIGGPIKLLGVADACPLSLVNYGDAYVASLGKLLTHFTYGRFLTNIDLWLGLAFTGVTAFAAARLRRYRDDS